MVVLVDVVGVVGDAAAEAVEAGVSVVSVADGACCFVCWPIGCQTEFACSFSFSI